MTRTRAVPSDDPSPDLARDILGYPDVRDDPFLTFPVFRPLHSRFFLPLHSRFFDKKATHKVSEQFINVATHKESEQLFKRESQPHF